MKKIWFREQNKRSEKMNNSSKNEKIMTSSQVRQILTKGIEELNCSGKRVLLIIPDGTRSMPMPLFFDLFEEILLPVAKKMDYLVALGTHQPMTDAQLSLLVGRTVRQNQVGEIHIYNHAWEDPGTFVCLGEISDSEIAQISEGRLKQAVPVTLNRLILDYDLLVVCGPVFPHEVVGFSGGNKYFFPGIAGPEIINLTHWLGALMTSYRIIGSGYTPVRAVIDRAAEMIPRETACFASVVVQGGLAGLYFGDPRQAWEAAAAHSARVHIVYSDRTYQTVLAVMPEMYDDLWTAAKGMYKLEPVIADGGEVIIYAPHISEVSYTHGKLIDEIGYHCRDYFTKQWKRFSSFPGGVLAHSTHVKGMGSYDPETGIEKPRITVTLATAIPQNRCKLINLGYRDPALIDIENYRGRESEGILVVPHAGEMLYRLKDELTQ